jgi:hypothetical protein
MSSLLIPLFWGAIVGCGTDEYTDARVRYSRAVDRAGLESVLPDTRDTGVDPEFQPFVESFEHLYGKSIGDIPINFGNTLDKRAAATCFFQMDGRREIVVSRHHWEYFKSVSIVSLEPIIWHELGHCVLLRKHSSGTMRMKNRLVPTSLMYPAVEYWQFQELRDYYSQELFNQNGRYY